MQSFQYSYLHVFYTECSDLVFLAGVGLVLLVDCFNFLDFSNSHFTEY